MRSRREKAPNTLPTMTSTEEDGTGVEEGKEDGDGDGDAVGIDVK